MSVEYVMISVAAERAGMHPQTLRVYEARGLVQPHRSNGNTRRYSTEDIQRLQHIQSLSAAGISLAGIEEILALETTLHTLQQERKQLMRMLLASRQQVVTLRTHLREVYGEFDHVTDSRQDQVLE
jgi:MerR family transcriptional regulator/heat shock protein HspR